MKVELADEAERDLETIGDYIARDNPERALTFIRELRERCNGLGSFPNRFPLSGIPGQTGIRRAIHGNYLIFSMVLGETITMLHILHGAADYAELSDFGIH